MEALFRALRITRDIALFALGGYGRQELNPASDIDLLFATRDGFPPPLEESVTKMMQLLWDLHLDLGHSTRSIDECLDAVSDDSHLATSVLEARFLCGSRDVADELIRKYRDMLAEGFGQSLAHIKIAERLTRIAAYRDTVQIQEPNIKECPGTLRDIHLMRWLMTIRDVTGIPSHIPAHMHADYEAELSFLLRARNALHYVTGKKTDILSHLMLPDIARNLGYRAEVLFRSSASCTTITVSQEESREPSTGLRSGTMHTSTANQLIVSWTIITVL